MSKEKKNTGIPRLRFPDFENAPKWKKVELGEVTYPVNERNKEAKKFPIYSINNVEGFLPQSDQFEGVDSHKRGYDISLYKVIGKNTFAYNPARINVGSIGYSGELHDIIISSLYVCFKTTEELDDLFLSQFLKTENFNNLVKNNSEGGIRNYLFYENFSRITLKLPSISEQQKIAHCLSSLNDLITAEIEKLGALKSYKKGLMQNLFPQAGETVPLMRFPEFKNDEEWREKSLQEILVEGRLGGNYENSDANVGIPVIKMGNLDRGQMNIKKLQYLPREWEYNKEDILKNNDLLFNTRNTLDLVGKVAIWKNELPAALYNSNLLRLSFHKDYIVSNVFMNYFFNTQSTITSLRSMATGTTSVAAIYTKDLLTLRVTFPSLPEQQKIADCLSSLDEEITAQTEKIDALKLHKKGLMQQLFPSPTESA